MFYWSPNGDMQGHKLIMYTLCLNICCLQINSLIFPSCCCCVFMQKLGYFFLVKSAKISTIFSSFTKITELTYPRACVPQASRLPSLFLAIVCSLDYFIKIFQNVSQIWSTLAAYEDMLWDLRVIRTERKMNNNVYCSLLPFSGDSRYTFRTAYAHSCPSISPTSTNNVECVYLEIFQKIFHLV